MTHTRPSELKFNLSNTDIRLIISSLSAEIKMTDKYFDNLDRKYSDFFRLQAQLAKLEAESEIDLQLSYTFIDSQISEWNRKFENWMYVRWYLNNLLERLRKYLMGVYRHAA